MFFGTGLLFVFILLCVFCMSPVVILKFISICL